MHYSSSSLKELKVLGMYIAWNIMYSQLFYRVFYGYDLQWRKYKIIKFQFARRVATSG